MGRTGCCGCKCMWRMEDWPLGGTGLVTYSHNYSSYTATAAKITGDGSNLNCFASDGISLKLGSNRSPCLELTIAATPDVSPTGPIFYTAYSMVVQTFPDWEFLPDGNSHALKATIDTSLRYFQSVSRNGSGGTNVTGPFDASVPTSYNTPRQVYVVVEQSGQHYWQTLPQGFPRYWFNGFNGAYSPGGVTGTWSRIAQQDLLGSISLNGSWANFLSPSTVTGSLFGSATLDMTSGADPIYFGWGFQVNAAMQVELSGSILVDRRFIQHDETVRIDRLCYTIL